MCVHTGVKSTDMQKPWVLSVIPVTHSNDQAPAQIC